MLTETMLTESMSTEAMSTEAMSTEAMSSESMSSESNDRAMKLRPATAADEPQIIELIRTVYAEYGEQLYLPGADRDLLDIDRMYAGRGGAFVVLDDDGRICASHATLPLAEQPGVCTFRRLYLSAELRGTGWGRKVMQWALDWAREHKLHRVEFWSDVRFTRAHAFFEKFGFRRGEIREMTDGAAPYREYFFSIDLTP
jgi:putative acetyltransferase